MNSGAEIFFSCRNVLKLDDYFSKGLANHTCVLLQEDAPLLVLRLDQATVNKQEHCVLQLKFSQKEVCSQNDSASLSTW